ncbi:MAG: hypothetical protein AB8B97_18245 [Granulosicoccus sp.]
MMMYIGFAGVVYVFISALMSGDGEVPSVPSLRVEIAHVQPGETDFLTWQGRPVVVYRRQMADVAKLRSEDSRLRDPNSALSEQPAFAQNAMRSVSPDYFVAIALGTGQGCTVEFLPAADDLFQGRSWDGGFMDSCGKDRYDLAGRVYAGQYATRNLKVPPYAIEGTTLILGR